MSYLQLSVGALSHRRGLLHRAISGLLTSGLVPTRRGLIPSACNKLANVRIICEVRHRITHPGVTLGGLG